MKKLKQFIQDEKGGSLVFVSISMVVLLASVGLIVDFGKLYVVKADLQKTANAAALSGAQELMNDASKVEEVVEIILDEHGQQDILETTEINMDQDVTVVLNEEVPLFFSKMFGFENVEVPVRAKAELIRGQNEKVTPIGIKEEEINYDEEYTLISYLRSCQDEEIVFRGLSLEGVSDDFVNNLRNGYVGEIINPKVTWFNKETAADIFDTKEGEIIYIPIIRYTNGSSNVIIEGFEHFKITKVEKPANMTSRSNFSIVGEFIKVEDRIRLIE
ncbi:Tad domain-containing protein [Chengkuizengella marina]|uniref:Putative Flp pilus-assembly TadG-like N-terminal domain-containing protein n=1 Tax=Chengkuizengella marina TaxID=2507566 RepID=A0A6N9Q0T8_9BACL|nr:Tad domain-containing protein [Chengkuizengella marina]NBI28363.1 hypothetical protein [Chengkuizengella marina]